MHFAPSVFSFDVTCARFPGSRPCIFESSRKITNSDVCRTLGDMDSELLRTSKLRPVGLNWAVSACEFQWNGYKRACEMYRIFKKIMITCALLDCTHYAYYEYWMAFLVSVLLVASGVAKNLPHYPQVIIMPDFYIQNSIQLRYYWLPSVYTCQ